MSLSALPIRGIPDVRPGDDLAALVVEAATHANGPGLADGDILVVTSKVVSKAEGRLVSGRDREQVIDEETDEVVSSWTGPHGRTVIARTRHGLVLAAAGVDASNVEPGTLVLLPEDPDASARLLRADVMSRTGATVGVVVSDTAGRAWRIGQTDMAIGAAGVVALDDKRGSRDAHGNGLDVTVRAVADEISAAAELVADKAEGVAAVVVRGLDKLVLPAGDDGDGAQALVRPMDSDHFRFGTAEAIRTAVSRRHTVRSFTRRAVPLDAIDRAVQAAASAPAPHHTKPWRFVLVQDREYRDRLLEAMRSQWSSDLRSDGLDPSEIALRVAKGSILREAPTLLVPFLAFDGGHQYPDERRREAEKAMFVLSMGAAVQTMLVALAADGLGSAWVASTLFCASVVRAALDVPVGWRPMGALAIGYPASPAQPRTSVDIQKHLTIR